MSHKEIMEAYRSMQELDEKKLSKDQKKEMDVDDDNDIDGDDLKKLRAKKKGKDEKDDEMEVRIEQNVNQAVDYAREKNSAATQAVMKMWEDNLEENKQTKGAVPPEKIDSKMSPKSKEFVAQHGMKVDNSVYPSQQTAVAAGRATSQAPARRGDKR